MLSDCTPTQVLSLDVATAAEPLDNHVVQSIDGANLGCNKHNTACAHARQARHIRLMCFVYLNVT